LEVTENGMTTKYQPNDANQYAKIAHGTEVVEPEYDPQGNLLHDATRQYTWDADIHLTSVTTEGHREPQRIKEPGTTGAAPRGAAGPVASEQASGLPHNALDEAPTKTTTSRFLYDPLHRRIARVKDSGEVTLYVYEGWNVVSEKTTPTAPQLDTENFKLETRYTWGEDLSGTLQGAGGIGGLLCSTRKQSPTKNEAQRTTKCFHYDSNGNIILLTGSQAQETARYSYDAFGQTLTATGPAAQINRYRFSTKPVEEESGLVYYGYRWYDPVTGRWPSRDPIGERGGVNLYGMVGNDAVNLVDYLGLERVTPIEDSLAVKVQVGDCEVVIIEGHGAKNIINEFEVPDSPRCGFFMGQDTCESNHTNATIPGNQVIPNLPNNPDTRPNAPSRVNDDAAKNKQTE
jgi:RHS repeat-associated protein